MDEAQLADNIERVRSTIAEAARQAGLHGVNFHHRVRQGANEFLLVGELFAEFLHCAAGRLQEDFLAIGDHADFLGKHAFRRFLE